MSIITPSRIILNHSYEEGESPDPESLVPGEIALNAEDDVLFYLDNTGNAVKRIPIGLDNLDISSILLDEFGENLLEDARVNPNGDLILTYKSGDITNLGNIKGPRGTGIQFDGTVEYESQLPIGNDLPPILNKSGTTYVVTRGESPGSDYVVDPGVARIFIYNKPDNEWMPAGKLSNTVEFDGEGDVTFAANPTVSGSLTVTSSSGSSSIVQAPLGSNQGLILRAGGSTPGAEGGNIKLTSSGDVNLDGNIIRVRSVNGGSTRLIVGNNGNVGIGTSTLTYRVNVDGTISSSNLITSGEITSGGTINAPLFNGNATSAARWSNARSLSVSGAINGNVNGIDGTGNINLITTLNTNIVGTDNIINGNITTSKIANEAITSDKIAFGAVNSNSIGGLQVTSDKIAADAITTSKIANQQITAQKLDGLQGGTAPVFGARAYGMFFGINGTLQNGTGTLITGQNIVTITITNHGLRVGDQVWLDFASGGTDQLIVVNEVVSPNIFRYVSSATTAFTNSAVSITRYAGAFGYNIGSNFSNGSTGNVFSIFKGGSGNGQYVVNFTMAMPLASYALICSGQQDGLRVAGSGNAYVHGYPLTAQTAYISVVAPGTSFEPWNFISFVVFAG